MDNEVARIDEHIEIILISNLYISGEIVCKFFGHNNYYQQTSIIKNILPP